MTDDWRINFFEKYPKMYAGTPESFQYMMSRKANSTLPDYYINYLRDPLLFDNIYKLFDIARVQHTKHTLSAYKLYHATSKKLFDLDLDNLISVIKDLVKSSDSTKSSTYSRVSRHSQKTFASNYLLICRALASQFKYISLDVLCALKPTKFYDDIVVDKTKELDSTKTLTKEEMTLLVETSKKLCPILHLIILIFMEIAPRITALSKMTTNCFYCDGNALVRGSFIDKGNVKRNFMTSAKLREAVESVVALNDPSCKYLFQINGRNMSTIKITDMIKKLAYTCGISKELTPHMFRYAFVTNLMDNGNRIEDVSKLIGHTSSDTTRDFYWRSDNVNVVKNTDIIFHNTKDNKLMNEELQGVGIYEDVDPTAVEALDRILSKIVGTIKEGCVRNTSVIDILTEIKRELPNFETIVETLDEMSFCDNYSINSNVDYLNDIADGD